MMNHPYATPSTLSHHPQQAALARQQALQHLPGMGTHAQGVPPTLQPPPQHAQNMAHTALQQQQQQQPPPPPTAPPQQPPQQHLLPQPPLPSGAMHGGGRKMADADAPPNVTVSTSTIPLSMAATLQQNQPPDLSSIVHQINQFCQARAGASATSVCEGQIANPSPISRNLLISASTRVSAHNVPTPLPSCVVNPGDHPTVPAPAPMGLPLGGGVGRGGPPPSYQSEMKQVAAAAAAAAAWNQHQLAHLQQMCGETVVGPSGLMGKPPGPRELPSGQGFAPSKASGYPLELCMGQPFNVKPPLEKPTPSPPVNGLPGPLPYANGHYFQPLWNNILPTPNSDSSGSQDLAMPFHGAAGTQAMAPALECPAGPHYRATGSGGAGGGGVPPGQSGMMQTMEYLSGDFQHSCLREQPGGLGLSKVARSSAMNRAPTESADSRSLHIQHPGYR
ncbi:protein FAM222B isoform X2 [Sceloporus undulatus]|nr:protein FAM222B isoform X2 [Sceloporus undulatus]